MELCYVGANSSMGLLSPNVTSVEVKVSNGVEVLNESDKEDVGWVARGPWRDLLAIEKSSLFIKSSTRWSNHLILVDLSSDLLKFAQHTLIEPLAATSGAHNDSLVKAIHHFRQYFCDALSAAGFKLDSAGPADLIVNPPGARSTAYDYGQDRPKGLHIDNHQAFPLESRESSFVLASINIGWQPRYLHFLPASVLTLLNRLNLPISCGLLPRELKNTYLRTYSNDPILRVTVPPGTAYLLRTQNCIHDGATLSGEIPDVVFLMMGNAI